MIYIVRNLIPPTELHRQRLANCTKYDYDSVITDLGIIFHNKCYICGEKSSSCEIEHFRPKGEPEFQHLKCAWGNLFLACSHCNKIKGDRFHQLLDCTDIRVNFDQDLKHKVELSEDGKQSVEVFIQNNSPQYQQTKELIELAFQGRTANQKLGAANLLDSLFDSLNSFYKKLEDYYLNQSNQNKSAVIDELRAESKFTAFKRTIILSKPRKYQVFINSW